VFRKNERHQQLGLFETVAQLPEKVRQRLERSWAGTFYQELFCRIDETKFAALYSDQPSRPNTPVNVLVGMEILKSGFGWSDEELYDAFLFDLQVRYALGLRDLETGNFELCTLYNFRHRLSRYMQQQGVNPLAEVFKQVTGEQLRAFGLKTAEQRMDATYVASNIARMSRLQLLVEVLQRVWRMLHDEDQAKLAACFAPYREDSAGQFCYRLKDSEVAAQLAAVGQLMVRLLNELAGQYHEQTTYQLLQRVVAEHFDLLPANGVPQSLPSAQAERGLSGPPQPGYADAPRAPGAADRAPEATVNVKPNGALRADALQSPDDPEATFRQTGSVGQRGYKANASETCDPENPFQLITWLQVAPNLIDDQQFLCAALPELMARTGLTKLWTDGGFTGAQARAAIRQHEIEQIPTGVRGIHLSSQQLGWHCFSWQMDSAGQPQAVTCPGGKA
jgi:hypothetical protein